MAGSFSDLDHSQLDGAPSRSDIQKKSEESETLSPLTSGDQEDKPWYEGLTTEERAEAKRKYKNRRAAKRWRNRKKEEKAEQRRQSEPFAQDQSLSGLPDGTSTSLIGPSSILQSSQDYYQNPKEYSVRSGVLLQNSELRRDFSQNPRDLSREFSQLPLAHRHEIPRPGLDQSFDLTNLTAQLDNIVEENTLLKQQVQGLTDAEAIRQLTSSQMLYEFQRLGKADESKLKALLCSMASFTVVQDGFRRNKEDVLALGEEIVNLQRGGVPSAQDTARKYQLWGIVPHSAWQDPLTPTFDQLTRIFAEEKENEFAIQVPGTRHGATAVMTIDRASRMHRLVHCELYADAMKQILDTIAMMLTKRNPMQLVELQNFICGKMKSAMVLASGYCISQSSAFAMQRATKRPSPCSVQDLQAARGLLSVSSTVMEELWNTWDAANKILSLLRKQKEQLEILLDSLLVLHDNTKEESFVRLLDAVKQLMGNYHANAECSLSLDVRCSQQILTPLQVGIVAGILCPKGPVKDCLAQGIDPVLRWTSVFESGLFPVSISG